MTVNEAHEIICRIEADGGDPDDEETWERYAHAFRPYKMATCLNPNCKKEFMKEIPQQDVCSEECWDAVSKQQSVSIKCAIVGCRKRIRGRLGQGAGGGAFYSLKGKYLADLRNQEYRCPDHR